MSFKWGIRDLETLSDFTNFFTNLKDESRIGGEITGIQLCYVIIIPERQRTKTSKPEGSSIRKVKARRRANTVYIEESEKKKPDN